MRVVLDTNVVVSGIFFGGVPRAILEACEDGRLELVLSPTIFDEYVRTCDRLGESHPSLSYRAALLRLLGEGTMVEDPDLEPPVTRDLDDDKFMLCARQAGASVVTGDQDLIEADGWSKVEVLTPRVMLDRLASAEGKQS